MKFVKERKKSPMKKKLKLLREIIRKWLGINAYEVKLHDTRVILFGLQKQIENKDIRTIRARARFNIKDQK
jgi:hypothetical protein